MLYPVADIIHIEQNITVYRCLDNVMLLKRIPGRDTI